MNKSALDDLRGRAERASSLDEVRTLLARVESAVKDRSLLYRDSGEVFLSLYTHARRLTEDDPQTGWKFVFDGLLPLYVHPSKVKNWRKGLAFHQCRELTERWLNEYRGPDAEQILERALAFFVDHLGSPSHAVYERACWAVQGIGYRTPAALAKLYTLLKEHPGPRGDEALRALVDIGVLANQQPSLRQESHRRVRRRLTSTLIQALRELADETTYHLLFGPESPPSMLKATDSDLNWLMSVLSHLAERAGAGPLCDEIVRTIARLHREHPRALDSAVYLGGYLLPHCDSPETARLIAELVAIKGETDEKTSHTLWLLDHRLRACVRPAQQAGMTGALGPEALAALQARALQTGLQTERATTFQGEAKRSALNTALTFGAADALSWLDPILNTEGNDFVLHEVIETFSCFRINPLPATIKHWITEQKDGGKTGANIQWVWRTAASMLARSACNEEAFEVLLRPGFTVDGEVMRSTVDSLADVALMLARGSDDRGRSIIEKLLSALQGEMLPPQASAVCHALATLAAESFLPETLLEIILNRAQDESLRIYPRSQLIATLGFFTGTGRSPHARHWLTQLAQDDDDWLGWRAMEALARLGILAEESGDLLAKLGLEASAGAWTWQRDKTQFQWSAGIIARLHEQRPQSFAPAAAAILRDGDYAQAAQLLPFLEKRQEPAVVEALVERIRQSHTPRTMEIGLFLHLGRLAPHCLADAEWSTRWLNWLPESRVDLADALYRTWPLAEHWVALGGTGTEEVVHLLVPLLGDGHFGVRRAAARALGRIAPVMILALAAEAASSSLVAERVRTVESLVWIPEAERGDLWQLLWDSLVVDRHKAVRQAAEQTHQAAQRREWGLHHLAKLLALREADNPAMLVSWRHGRALAHTGDDEALWRLIAHLEEDRDLPLNVRFFKTRVAKDLEKNWADAVKKKWPEPVAAARGSTETGEGVYVAPSGREYPVVYTMWRSAATIDRAGTRWGGSARVKGDQSLEDGILAEEGTFRWEDGRVAGVHATRIDNARSLIFSGSAAYPLAGAGSGTPLDM